MHKSLLVLYIDQFFVYAGLDMNYRGVVEAGRLRHRIDRFLHSFELAGAISGYGNICLRGGDTRRDE